MALLLVLLVLAYIGSMWASSERKRAFGSPSGVEYVVLGLLLGPETLGVLGHGAIAALEPIAIVALGWIGLVYGLECGRVGERAAPARRIALGLLFTVVTALSAASAAFGLLGYFQLGAPAQHALISGAVGLVTAETTRHAVRWIGERQPLSGPLADLLLDLAAADDAPVLLALALLFAAVAGEHTLFGLPIAPPQLAALNVLSGALLGVLSAFLIRRASSKVERWTILIGATWLATGTARSLGLSALSSTFTLGLTLSALSSEAPLLRAKVAQTEGAVLLPALLLAGAHLSPPTSDAEIALIAGALGMRIAVSFTLGYLLSFLHKDTRGLGAWLGAGMLASGTLTTIVAFGIALRFPAAVARPALAIAFLGTLLGEVVGPTALRHAFGHSSVPPPLPGDPSSESERIGSAP